MKISSRLIKLFIEAFKECVRDRAGGMASALAYFQLLAIAPLVGFLIFISIKVLGIAKTKSEVVPVLKDWFTTPFIKVITFIFESTEKMDVSNLATLSIVAGIILAFATNNYFGQIKDTIEIVWNQKSEKPGIKEGIRRFFEDMKVIVVSFLIIIIFLFLRSLLPHPYITPKEPFVPSEDLIVLFIQGAAEMLLFFVLYLYYFSKLPPLKVYWKNAVPGALLGAFFYEIGRVIMRIDMYNNPEASLAESFLAILIWLFYVNYAFVYAAEFSKVYIARKQKIDVRSLKFDE